MLGDFSSLDDGIEDNTKISIVMIGDSSVGKSSLISAFTDKPVNQLSFATIGIEQHSKIVNYRNVNYLVKIWDTCGQERFRNISKNYIRSGDGLILVYDLTNETTYDTLNKWLDDIKESCHENIPIVIAENKNDLQRVVDKESSDELRIKYPNIPIFETSMLDKNLVNKCFMKLIAMIVKQHQLDLNNISQEQSTQTLKKVKTRTKKKKCCD